MSILLIIIHPSINTPPVGGISFILILVNIVEIL